MKTMRKRREKLVLMTPSSFLSPLSLSLSLPSSLFSFSTKNTAMSNNLNRVSTGGDYFTRLELRGSFEAVLSALSLSLSLFLFHSFLSFLLLSTATTHQTDFYPASLNASMMNAQAAPILKAFSSLSLKLLVPLGFE